MALDSASMGAEAQRDATHTCRLHFTELDALMFSRHCGATPPRSRWELWGGAGAAAVTSRNPALSPLCPQVSLLSPEAATCRTSDVTRGAFAGKRCSKRTHTHAHTHEAIRTYSHTLNKNTHTSKYTHHLHTHAPTPTHTPHTYTTLHTPTDSHSPGGSGAWSLCSAQRETRLLDPDTPGGTK